MQFSGQQIPKIKSNQMCNGILSGNSHAVLNKFIKYFIFPRNPIMLIQMDSDSMNLIFRTFQREISVVINAGLTSLFGKLILTQ